MTQDASRRTSAPNTRAAGAVPSTMTATDSRDLTLEELLTQAGWAHRLARTLVRDGDDADDLVQEAWIAAARRPPNIEGSPRPWLATVLRNQGAKRAQAERRRGAREQAYGDAGDAASSPEELLGRVEAQKVLAGLVTALDEPYRQCVLLRYYEGLTSVEIGERLGVPAGTVRWRLKTALERLRAALDEKNEGDRSRWLGLLAPLAPARAEASGASGRRASAVSVRLLGLVALSAAVVAVPLALWRASGGPSSAEATGAIATTPGGAPPLPPGGESRSGGARRFAATAGLAACQQEVARLRRDVVAAETEAMKEMRGQTLFERGAPNPAAEKELAPVIERIMKTGQAAAPSYTLECRTWVCKMLVAKTPEEATSERTNAWVLPLQRDPDMMARKTSASFWDVGRAKDPLSGVELHRDEVYLTLRDPSAKAVGQSVGGPRPDSSFGVVPAGADACAREATALRARLDRARGDVERDMRPDQRFAASPPNPTLTREINAELGRIFAGDVGMPVATCRGHVCKLEGPEPKQPWFDRAEADRELRLRIEGATCCSEAIFVMKTPAQLAATRWLRDLLDDFAAGPALAACEKQHPARGALLLSLKLAEPGEPNGDGVVDAVSVKTGGALGDGPLGRCIADEARRAFARAKPPHPFAAAHASKRFELPLPPR